MNIKRILALLLSALAVVCLLSGCAKEEEERELKPWENGYASQDK